ncbi:MAG TPA: PDR/VanB family oxidoreductase [Kineosporiaceae bacterium]|nr:PDR/VanB family oxidoreductase [Kineosporiaceae bacterium]
MTAGTQSAVHPDVEVELELVIRDAELVADDVRTLRLQHPDGTPLPDWTPGAHLDLILENGLTRQYSLCGPLDRPDEWQVAVLRTADSAGGSAFVHDELAAGSTVRVRGPRNHFALVDAPEYLFIVGGIGITPVLAMIRRAVETGATWTLLYGGRQPTSMAFVPLLQELSEASAGRGRVLLWPQESHGLLPLAEHLADHVDGRLVYCCGPEPLIHAVEAATSTWPPGSLHVERFSPVELGEPVRTEGFEVELALSGRTLAVRPDQSVLEAVLESGIEVLSSCQEGICGTCETGVLAGTPDHRDSILSPQERDVGDVMMICVSRSIGPRLTLEL